MFKHDEGIVTPPDDTKLWRYMSFAQFVHMLETRTLWFSTKEGFEDRWEGSYSHKTLKRIADHALKNNMSVGDVQHIKIMKWFQEKMVLNCWHANKSESVAMWEYYGKGRAAVAVCSSVGAIKKGLTTNYNFNIGQVEYLNYEDAAEIEGLVTKFFLRKRNEYQFENEVRVIIDSKFADGRELDFELFDGYGIAVRIDPAIIVEAVVPSPKCQLWEHELIELLLKRHGVDSGPLVKSVLTTDPITFATNIAKQSS